MQPYAYQIDRLNMFAIVYGQHMTSNPEATHCYTQPKHTECANISVYDWPAKNWPSPSAASKIYSLKTLLNLTVSNWHEFAWQRANLSVACRIRFIPPLLPEYVHNFVSHFSDYIFSSIFVAQVVIYIPFFLLKKNISDGLRFHIKLLFMAGSNAASNLYVSFRANDFFAEISTAFLKMW